MYPFHLLVSVADMLQEVCHDIAASSNEDEIIGMGIVECCLIGRCHAVEAVACKLVLFCLRLNGG